MIEELQTAWFRDGGLNFFPVQAPQVPLNK